MCRAGCGSVTEKTKAQLDAEKTAAAARELTRRTVLRGAAAGAALAAGPFAISRGVLASSGEIDIMMWSDYLPPEFIADFVFTPARTDPTVVPEIFERPMRRR